MPYTADTEIDLSTKIKSNYIISSQHRKVGNVNKSIWTISFDEEVDCFVTAINGKWIAGNEAWGVKVNGGSVQVVGKNIANAELKLAKFVDGTSTNVWHGYPADYMSKSQDRPITDILRNWVKAGYISKAAMNKIRTGKACSL
ncbi:MAG: hypothetical protein EOO19_12230 [Chryseobacterium sp.]|nr:MAG: hypothetical protein EOO19_12230 [Chryseobacterium sp.]